MGTMLPKVPFGVFQANFLETIILNHHELVTLDKEYDFFMNPSCSSIFVGGNKGVANFRVDTLVHLLFLGNSELRFLPLIFL